jgi:hypothetical protein
VIRHLSESECTKQTTESAFVNINAATVVFWGYFSGAELAVICRSCKFLRGLIRQNAEMSILLQTHHSNLLPVFKGVQVFKAAKEGLWPLLCRLAGMPQPVIPSDFQILQHGNMILFKSDDYNMNNRQGDFLAVGYYLQQFFGTNNCQVFNFYCETDAPFCLAGLVVPHNDCNFDWDRGHVVIIKLKKTLYTKAYLKQFTNNVFSALPHLLHLPIKTTFTPRMYYLFNLFVEIANKKIAKRQKICHPYIS